MRNIVGTVSAVLLALAGTAGIALAKDGVTNPAVKARMEHMQQIKSRLDLLGQMAEGKISFDASRAVAEAAALAALAIEVPQEFEPAESDPVSEATPKIWSDFSGFSRRADALYQAAQAINATSQNTLAASVKDVAASCKSCHDSYRK